MKEIGLVIGFHGFAGRCVRHQVCTAARDLLLRYVDVGWLLANSCIEKQPVV